MNKASISNILTRVLKSNILLYCVVLVLALKIFTILIPINLPYNIFFADITKSSLEIFVNQTRQSLGLQTLSENEKLNQAARLKAENMVQNNYFNHTSPTGVSPWFWFKQVGYNYKYAGENLAVGFYESEEVYNAWLNSPSHKENILNPNYTEIGTAVVRGFGPSNTVVVVQEFGRPVAIKSPEVNNNPSTSAQVKQPAVQVPQNVESVVTEPSPDLTPENTEPQAQNINTEGKVLSQSVSLEQSSGFGVNDLHSRILNFVIYNYDNLLQYVVYGVFVLVMSIMLSLIFFDFKVNFRRDLVFRAVLIIVLLSIATTVNKEAIIFLIPHQVII